MPSHGKTVFYQIKWNILGKLTIFFCQSPYLLTGPSFGYYFVSTLNLLNSIQRCANRLMKHPTLPERAITFPYWRVYIIDISINNIRKKLLIQVVEKVRIITWKLSVRWKNVSGKSYSNFSWLSISDLEFELDLQGHLKVNPDFGEWVTSFFTADLDSTMKKL